MGSYGNLWFVEIGTIWSSVTLIAELLIKLIKISELNKHELLSQFTQIIIIVKMLRNESTVDYQWNN